MFSISAALILPCFLPVVLVYSLLGLFICVVDLSSIRFKCFKFICVVAFFVLVNNIVLISSTHVLFYVVVASSD